jgi:predicted anti-sigma-YlaC factor YlaD
MTAPVITCDEARDALLVADLAELDGSRPGSLAAHLAGCPLCQALADRVLAATDALRAERAVPPRRAPPAAATLARAEANRLRRARRARWALAPILAAAGLAAVLLVRGGPEPGRPLAARPAPPPPLVESPAAKVAVFTTDNPNIVVVWQF